jgi:RNA polymerase sigma-70 factor (ECF subfamily)
MDAADAVLGAVPAEASTLDAAFVALYRATFRQIYAYARAHVADAATAEELTSRIYLKAYGLRDRAPAGERQRYWLFRIAVTTVVDHYRAESRRRAITVSLDELGDVEDAGTADPEQRLLARERAAALLTAIGELGARDRELLLLKFAGRQTNQEIGEVLRVSPAAVSMRLMRALRQLRQRLRPSDPRP